MFRPLACRELEQHVGEPPQSVAIDRSRGGLSTRSRASGCRRRVALDRARNLVERFFGKLKQFRATAISCDKLANTFLAAVAMVCVLFRLN